MPATGNNLRTPSRYLSRTPAENDRRQLTIALTERGQAAADVQRQAREQIDAELTTKIGKDDVSATRRALGTLIDMQRNEADPAN